MVISVVKRQPFDSFMSGEVDRHVFEAHPDGAATVQRLLWEPLTAREEKMRGLKKTRGVAHEGGKKPIDINSFLGP